MSLTDGAQKTVCWMNLFLVTLCLDGNKTAKATYKSLPPIWHTRAPFGLTLFQGDFIDYTKGTILVNDIAQISMVVGIGTTLRKFQVDSDTLFLTYMS